MRVLLAGDHRMVREGLRIALERNGVDVVPDGEGDAGAVDLARIHRPDVALLDFVNGGSDAIDCARALLAEHAATGVVLLSIHADEHRVAAALRAGVRGYVLKSESLVELLHAIREVGAGGTYLSARVSHVLTHLYIEGAFSGDSLTPRQREVLGFIGDGLATREIAARLGVSDKTVELYRSRIMARLDIHDTAGLVRYAIRSGLSKL